ncbi:integrase [Dysgonomonas hofstadii]|uniref:Integrase n=1 Tax=Dysgonomonas hofstadii TaxID=637886 RepID=A0A840CP72_9BACT|nr:site-specific integrase [Dysgonomonas hofstadii]MBB4035334.1 integrase [Dysgonomonas hofstadii]
MSFIYRYSSRGGGYTGSLNLRFIHKRKVKQLSTPFKLYPNEWSASRQQVIHQHPDRESYLRQVEEYLQQSRHLFAQTIRSLEKEGAYGLQEIISHFQFNLTDIGLKSFVRQLSGELIRLGQERTARAYWTVTCGIIEFNSGRDIPLSHINCFLIKSYERSLKEKGRRLNTISFYMRNLRAIYNKAIRKGYIEAKNENPFLDVYTGVDKTRKRALSAEEIQRLHDLEFSGFLDKGKTSEMDKSSLYKAWRIFFFCFHTRGMSFVDMAYLRKDNIHGEIIRYYRKKTGQLIEVKITSKLQLLIDSFAGEVKDSPYLFPIIRNNNKSKRLYYESGLRQQNRCLKSLAAKAGINRCLSTHVSRHSWATMAKKENLPIWVISESLGHSNEKTTYTYLAALDRSILDQANDIVSAAIGMTTKRQYLPKY